ncbi:Proliferation-associated protein 2G4 [Smittium mucronatum]|uniref:Proliferation-associated protein 2G4 n=1 Tax=Smittium mucronatum TaxID=133383 RepID=A0A1R0H7B1_9FUNG|nr:Proliferation-associated protein 2G4 [Smittium mucronatum]OLY85003.1 Proliferation-associated protein 2G4 [Smittium mucronatum]
MMKTKAIDNKKKGKAEEVPEEEYTLNDPTVIDKYKSAANVANQSLLAVLENVKEGASIFELCKIGDNKVAELCKKSYTKASFNRGLSYPTSVSVNDIACHFSPLESDAEAVKPLSKGDVVKVQLGAHFDGLAAVIGHTVVVGASEAEPVTGEKADLLSAAHYAAEGILRMIKPGKMSTEISDVAQKITKTFDCSPLEGSLCHNQTRNKIDGEKHIVLNPSDEQRNKVKINTVEVGEVYLIDILVSGGQAKPRPSKNRTTVYCKSGTNYKLKMQVARSLYSEVNSKFGTFPFSLRCCEDERKARMGVIECAKSHVLEAFDVIEEKDGHNVAQVCFSVMVTPNGVSRLTSGPAFNNKIIVSDKKFDAEITALLNTSPKSLK